MTLFEVLKTAQERLKSVTEDNRFDSWILFSYCFGMSRSEYFSSSQSQADTKKTTEFFELVSQREKGRPLQYIVGKWSFRDCEFYVGEGVLIPRADTECLVEEAARIINKEDVKTVYDLCSGTGCIGITLAKMFDDIEVVCFEKSDDAFDHLKKNVSLNNVKNVKAVKGDLFDGGVKYSLDSCEMIVSNPPYIRSGEIASLQKEVLLEPREALDGGDDGLEFYRVLKEKCFDKIISCRIIIMECGDDQADDVSRVFSEYENVSFVKDLNSIRRDVCVFKNGVK